MNIEVLTPSQLCNISKCWLFHGSSTYFDICVPHQAYDADGSPETNDFGVYAVSIIEYAICFAFKKNRIVGVQSYGYEVCSSNNKTFCELNNMQIDPDSFGYLYCFNREQFTQIPNRRQFICKHSVVPQKTYIVYYKDFDYLFKIYKKDTDAVKFSSDDTFKHCTNYLTTVVGGFTYCNLGIPLRLSSDLFYSHMLQSDHGIAHTSRVLFASYLIVSMEDGVSEDIKKASYYAAIIHDLGKKSDGDGEYHGANSLSLYDKFLDDNIDDENIRQLVKDAIQYHSIEDYKCPEHVRNNILWKILKDADALDRSRFRNGCDESYLRMPIFNTSNGKVILFITKELPRLTRNCTWIEPYEDIYSAIIGLKKQIQSTRI